MEKKVVGTWAVISFAIFIFIRVSNSRRKKRKSVCELSEDDLWNTAIFYPDWFPDQETSRTRQLIWYLEQAELKIDVCMFGFSFKMFKDAIMKVAKEKGVAVRILCDRRAYLKNGYKKNGPQIRSKIHIRRNPLDENMFVDLMHHKFVVIDDRGVIAGSQNWTRVSIVENFENVVITNNSKVVSQFSKEFEKLWEESLPFKQRKMDIMQPC